MAPQFNIPPCCLCRPFCVSLCPQLSPALCCGSIGAASFPVSFLYIFIAPPLPPGPRPTLSPSHVVLAPAMCDDRLCPALYSDQLWCSSIRIPFQSVGSNWGRDSLWLYCFGSDQRAVPSFRCCQSQIGFQTAILPRPPPPPPPLVSSSPVPFTPSISLIRWVQHTPDSSDLSCRCQRTLRETAPLFVLAFGSLVWDPRLPWTSFWDSVTARLRLNQILIQREHFVSPMFLDSIWESVSEFSS